MKKWIKWAIGGAVAAGVAGVVVIFSATHFFDEEASWTKMPPPDASTLQSMRQERERSKRRGEKDLADYLTLRLALQNDPDMLKVFAADLVKLKPARRPRYIRYIDAKYGGEPGVPCIIWLVDVENKAPSPCPAGVVR